MRNDLQQILFELYAPTKKYGEEVFGFFYKTDNVVVFLNETECTVWTQASTNYGFVDLMLVGNVGDGLPQFIKDDSGESIIIHRVYGDVRVYKES
jgi:hypothetical protein